MQGLDIGWVDIAMLALVVLSVLGGMMRGLTFEVLSLAGWAAAWFAAVWLGPWVAAYLTIGETGSALNQGIAYAGVFFGVLIVWGFAARAVARLVRATPLKPVDRLLGAAFGVARAVLVLLVLVTLVQFSPFARSDAWQASRGVVAVDAMRELLLPFVTPEPSAGPGSQRV